MAAEGANESERAGSERGVSDDAVKPAPSSESQAPRSLDVDAPRPPASKSSVWPGRLLAASASFYEWLSRPRVRLAVTGVILLLIGGVLMANSVWTLPLVIVGALMIVTAWMGGRLDGRFAVEWGETGTHVEFRAKIKTAQPARPALTSTSSNSHQLVRMPEPTREPEVEEIIDGEAHTVEIAVAELEALIAAVETTKAQSAQTRS